jgi:ribosomal protein L21E
MCSSISKPYRLISDINVHQDGDHAILSADIEIDNKMMRITWHRDCGKLTSNQLKSEFIHALKKMIPMTYDMGATTRKITVTKGEVHKIYMGKNGQIKEKTYDCKQLQTKLEKAEKGYNQGKKTKELNEKIKGLKTTLFFAKT